MVKKNPKGKSKMANSWSPGSRETVGHRRRYHDGEEYTRVGDEYRAKRIEADDAKCWEDEGYARRRSSRDVYNKSDGGYFSANSERRRSYGTDAEQEKVSSEKTTNAVVHRDSRVSKSSEAFRYFFQIFDSTFIFRGLSILLR